MRKLLSSLAVTGVVLAAGTSFAATASMDVTGTVKSITPKHIVLEDGSTYNLPHGLKVPKLKTGESVKIAYTKHGKTYEANSVTLSK